MFIQGNEGRMGVGLMRKGERERERETLVAGEE